MQIKTIILAAGQGTRMQSAKPKVLHKIAGKALLEHVYDMCEQLSSNEISIVYGHGAEHVLSELAELHVDWIEQKQQLGTGHAVQQAIGNIEEGDVVLILYGDVPLLKLATVNNLIAHVGDASMALLTVNLNDPTGYGRIIRDTQGRVSKIVEEKDAAAVEKNIHEVNSGIMALQGRHLIKWLKNLSNDNVQQEYYLTDIIAMAVSEQIEVKTHQPADEDEVLGVNNRAQLSHLERVYQREQAEQLMARGVSLADPARFDCRGKILNLGFDIEIDVNVILEGNISIGNNVKIGANCLLKNAVLEDGVELLANCVIEDAHVGAASRIGPFARLRPETRLAERVHIGNFVEIKKSSIAPGSKVNHLSYIGDTEIGSQVNIGAGTITCNYDGANKFKTIIEDGAFIGSDTQLVAPVKVGKNATIGAGSTITDDAPAEQLTLSRNRQMAVAGWQRPVKLEK